ncbi:MAG TPA: PaaI family thioesterase [Rhizomicrobium sp.]|nr:PaaI family thioesterase [Rhizomicrobium sp.]
MSALLEKLSGYRATRLIDPFENFVGPLYEIGEKLARRYAFVVDERHVNMRGVIHGGMLMTLADMTMGQAAWDACDHADVVTLNMQSQFIRGARLGEIVEVQPVLTRRTRSIIFLRGDFMVGDEIIFSCASLWKILGQD